jgi:hypothetical protein
MTVHVIQAACTGNVRALCCRCFLLLVWADFRVQPRPGDQWVIIKAALSVKYEGESVIIACEALPKVTSFDAPNLHAAYGLPTHAR